MLAQAQADLLSRMAKEMPGVVRPKLKLQERYQLTEILFRLDIDGAPHRNPDSTLVPTPHLHIYRQGSNDLWAFPVPQDLDPSSGDPAQILGNFLAYCGVNPVPLIQGGARP